MAAVTERLTADTDDRSSATAQVVDKPQTDSCADDARPPSTTTTRRSRLAAVATSAALLGLLLMTTSAFCVWTTMRLSRIEARLERLERTGRHPVNHVVEPPRNADHFARHLPAVDGEATRFKRAARTSDAASVYTDADNCVCPPGPPGPPGPRGPPRKKRRRSQRGGSRVISLSVSNTVSCLYLISL